MKRGPTFASGRNCFSWPRTFILGDCGGAIAKNERPTAVLRGDSDSGFLLHGCVGFKILKRYCDNISREKFLPQVPWVC